MSSISGNNSDDGNVRRSVSVLPVETEVTGAAEGRRGSEGRMSHLYCVGQEDGRRGIGVPLSVVTISATPCTSISLYWLVNATATS